MFELVRTVPHRSVREAQTADGSGFVDGEPNFDGSVFLREAPAGRQFAGQSLGQGLARIRAPVAVFAGHLGHQVEGRLPFRLGSNGVMEAKEPVPIDVVGGPGTTTLEVAGSMTQLV